MESQEMQEVIDANENRKAIYTFLATVYGKELNKQFIQDLAKKKSFFQRLAEDPETEGTEIAEGFRALAAFASDVREDALDDIQLQLAAEYAGLFLGVRQCPAHPSESAYMSTDHLIMGKARDDVLALYRTMSLERNIDFTEPEDHIALELQFMADLSAKATQALRTGNQGDARRYLEVQRSFLKDHLMKWVPLLVADVLKSGRREFYKAVAKVTRGFIEMDQEMVLGLIETLS
jgi:TorA maturation chaperone TorD